METTPNTLHHFIKPFLLITIALSQLCDTAFAARTLATAHTQFIRTSCSATTYPRLCYASLASQATVIRSDPKLLATAAMSVMLSTAKSTAAAMVNTAHDRGMMAREIGAMRDCMDELSDSVDELERSIVEMGLKTGINQLRRTEKMSNGAGSKENNSVIPNSQTENVQPTSL